MKNADKFKEVFGFEPRMDKCLSESCRDCPLKTYGLEMSCYSYRMVDWWNSEYKGSEATND